jgi:hypothetical protein
LLVPPVAAQATAAPQDWTQSPAIGPPAGVGGYLSYDSGRHRAVLFGGTTNANTPLYGDTWEFDGTAWTKVASTGPSARAYGQMVYDPARGVSVLFGGFNGTIVGETWEWNGTSWTQRTTANTPPPRVWFGMTYDSTRQRTVLFGGENGVGDLGDTWEYDGTNWTHVVTAHAPDARGGPALAFDPILNRVVLFGGHDVNARVNDTWEYDGSDWTHIATADAPSPRFWYPLVYDPDLQREILFGGDYFHDGFLGPNNETWQFDGSDWSAVITTHRPSRRTHSEAVYDDVLHRVVLYGGDNQGLNGTTVEDGDTWMFGGTPTWPGAQLSKAAFEFINQPFLIATSLSITLTNTAGSTMTIGSIAISGSPDISVRTHCPLAPSSIPAGGQCVINVRFDPTSSGPINGEVELRDAAGTLAGTIPFLGYAVGAGVFPDPSPMNFGSNAFSASGPTASMTLTLAGSNPYGYPSVITGLHATAPYAATNLDCPIHTPMPTSTSCHVRVDFSPSRPGSFPGTLTIHDNAVGLEQTVSLAGVATAPLSGSFSPFIGREDSSFDPQVATFGDSIVTARASEFTATIQWGDGTSSAGAVAGTGPFVVHGSHAYAEGGSFPVSVAVSDRGAPSLTEAGTVSIYDYSIQATGTRVVSPRSFRGPLATFIDSDPTATSSEYTVSIDWGDATTSTGTVSGGASPFTISGTHTYTGLQRYIVQMTLQDAGGRTASVSSRVITTS